MNTVSCRGLKIRCSEYPNEPWHLSHWAIFVMRTRVNSSYSGSRIFLSGRPLYVASLLVQDRSMNISVSRFVVTDFVQNMRVLWSEKGAEVIVVDPGGEVQRLEPLFDEIKPSAVHILLTHAHLDHGGGVASLQENLKARGLNGGTLYASSIEREIRACIPEHALLFGLSAKDYRACPEPDVYLEGSETLEFLGIKWQVLFTPGHSPGHLAFFAPAQTGIRWKMCGGTRSQENVRDAGLLIGGDVLFRESVGRVDLPGGNEAQLLHSIRKKLFLLPDDTHVCTGHGGDTTIGHEKRHNPFVA